MSFYSKDIKIDGKICGIVMRGNSNGYYQCVFEREFANLEDIEAINWSKPVIEGKTVLPEGYGFDLVDIKYNSELKTFTATIATQKQYLGDVEDANGRIEELKTTVAEKEQMIAEKENELAQKNQTIEELTTANTTLNEQLIQVIGTKDEEAE